MKRTYEEFIEFVKAFEEQNCFEFDEEVVEQPDPMLPVFSYDATFRDEANYKTSVLISFNGLVGEITWEVTAGWADAVNEIEVLYDNMFDRKCLKPLVATTERLLKLRKHLQEAQADIALNAGYMLANREIDISDSRELISNVIAWADEFVSLDSLTQWKAEDYMEAIDEFAKEKLIEHYGY